MGAWALRRGALALFAGLVASTPFGCVNTLGTNRLLTLFNGGVTDSMPDPRLTPRRIAEERVALVVRNALIRGYFTQGRSEAGSVGPWLSSPEVQGLAWAHLVERADGRPACLTAGAPTASVAPSASPPAASADVAQLDVTQAGPVVKSADTVDQERCTKRFREELVGTLTRGEPGPACTKAGAPTRAASVWSDATRLAAGLELATSEVAKMIVEEQSLTIELAQDGFLRGMREAGAYLAARRWTPSTRVPTFGIAIKGGASTGVYSAGATWRILTLLQRYEEYKRATTSSSNHGILADEARFAVTSGTSAGAIIAAVVDIYHQDRCEIDAAARDFRDLEGMPERGHAEGGRAQCREYARRLLASLFTCMDQSQLYCADNRPLWELADTQKGLMDFNKLRDLLTRYVRPDALINQTELALTTVDFRWGHLYVQTDQDPSSVAPTPSGGVPGHLSMSNLHRSIEASFVLPFIAWPVESLRIGGRERPGIYLDGGIKSEVPLLALSQRGVERAVVVGSSPPEVTPVEAPMSAATIAARYLDVSLSAVTEGEWKSAVPVTRYLERAEQEACTATLCTAAAASLDLDPERRKFFCTANLAAACEGESALFTPGDDARQLTRDGGRAFEVMGIFRKENIDPTYGYSFDPIQMKRLFDAGAEAVRERCLDMTVFLGMGDAPLELRMKWCNETPVKEDGLCTPEDEKGKLESCHIDAEREKPQPPE